MERRDVAGHQGQLAPLPAACEGPLLCTLRQFAAEQEFGRFLSEADIEPLLPSLTYEYVRARNVRILG
jgi:hypothetical protein